MREGGFAEGLNGESKIQYIVTVQKGNKFKTHHVYIAPEFDE